MFQRFALPATFVLGAAVAFSQAPAPAMTDQSFVDQAAQTNMTEAHLGKLAQDRGVSDDVKQYGQMLESDHKKAYDQLTRIASGKGLNVPQAIDSQHQQSIQRFESLSGQNFDQQFRKHMVNSHQKAIDMFQGASEKLQLPELKTYAADLVPVLRKHDEAAKELGTGAVMSNAKPGNAGAGTAEATSQRARADATMDPAGKTATHHGTVTRFEPGKTLALKMRDRSGRHVYDLTQANAPSNLPADLKVGSKVVVTEATDKNGYRSMRIELDSAAPTTAP